MIKKTLATAAVAVSVVGVGAAAATPAMAVGDHGHTTTNGNEAVQKYGNTTTGGYMSPNMSLVNGTANKLCAVVLGDKLNVGSLVGVVPVTVQDIATSSNAQNCSENSTQIDGDDPLSHILSDISLLSENGASAVRGG
ncbi:rodlin [Streptomyces sp. 549]|uniref:rodlin n=1 Tax=Streptomyces sp. 549 TaxID=3049076 RepID=UPI0024C42F4C|nr:rodlin [Streptomyces sp. 549]MDK1473924.1 rodlin [Streptomyces sp. 549]